jgi:thiol-disulfide isomerase/thioredoxin
MNITPVYPAPDFKEIKQWSNGMYYSIKDFIGKVILSDFWTYTCIYCLRTIPLINEINTKYKDKGVVILPIHSAECEFAKDSSNIEKAIATLNLNEYSIGFDTKNKTWERYGNSYWPKHIFIDKQGFVRYEQAGFGKLKDFEIPLGDLLDMPYSKEYSNEEKDKEEGIEDNEITKIYGMHFIDMAP